jgi:hypothetical protein
MKAESRQPARNAACPSGASALQWARVCAGTLASPASISSGAYERPSMMAGLARPARPSHVGAWSTFVPRKG